MLPNIRVPFNSHFEQHMWESSFFKKTLFRAAVVNYNFANDNWKKCISCPWWCFSFSEMKCLNHQQRCDKSTILTFLKVVFNLWKPAFDFYNEKIIFQGSRFVKVSFDNLVRQIDAVVTMLSMISTIDLTLLRTFTLDWICSSIH